MLTILDDYNRATWIFLLSNKSQTVTKINTFFRLVKKLVKSVRTNDGAKFMSRELKKFQNWEFFIIKFVLILLNKTYLLRDSIRIYYK